MNTLEESDYSNAADVIIQNYEKRRNLSIPKNKVFKKTPYTYYSNSPKNISDSSFFEDEEEIKEKKEIKKIKENKNFTNTFHEENNVYESSGNESRSPRHKIKKEKDKNIFSDDNSFDSLVEDFFEESLKKRVNTKNEKEKDKEKEKRKKDKDEEEFPVHKKNENKILTKKMIQRNKEILKKDTNKPLMPLLKKNTILYTQRCNPTYKKKTSPPKLIQVKHKQEWNSFQNDLSKYKLTKEELEKKRKSLKSKNLEKARIECQNKLQYTQEKRKSVLNNNLKFKNNFEVSDREKNKKIEIYQKKEKKKTPSNKIKPSRIKNGMLHTREESEKEIKSEDSVEFEINDRTFTTRRKSPKKGETDKKKLIPIEKKKNIYYNENMCLFKNTNEIIPNSSCSNNDSYIYREESMISSEEEYMYDSLVSSSKQNILKKKSIKTNNDNIIVQTKNNVEICKEQKENDNLSKNEETITFIEDEFSSDELTLNDFKKYMSNFNEEFSTDIDISNIQKEIAILPLGKINFDEKKYFPDIDHLNNLYENSNVDTSTPYYYSSELELENIFSSNYSDEIKKITCVSDEDNVQRLKKVELETLKSIHGVMKLVNNFSDEKEEMKNRMQKKDKQEHIVFSSVNGSFSIDKTNDRTNMEIENIEKKEIYPLVDLLFKEEEEREIEEQKQKQKLNKSGQMNKGLDKIYGEKEINFAEMENEKMNFYDFNIYNNESINQELTDNIEWNNAYANDHQLSHSPRKEENYSESNKHFSQINTFPNTSSKLNIEKRSNNERLHETGCLTSIEGLFSEEDVKYAEKEIEKKTNKLTTIDEDKNEWDKKDINDTDLSLGFDFFSQEIYEVPKEYDDKKIMSSFSCVKSSKDLKDTSYKTESVKSLPKPLLIENREVELTERERNDKNCNMNESGKESSFLFSDDLGEYKSKQSHMKQNHQKKIAEVENSEKQRKIAESKLKTEGKRKDMRKDTKTIKEKGKSASNKPIFTVKKNDSKETKFICELKENATKVKNEKRTSRCNSKKKLTNVTNENKIKGTNIFVSKTNMLKNNRSKNTFSEIPPLQNKSSNISSKENRIINQKICNTSLDFRDMNNLSDDDDFIFKTYLNNENMVGEEKKKTEKENLSDIINNQVKAFERAFF